MCGRLRIGKGFLHACSIGRSSHVFGLLARHTWPLAIMPSADQVPVKNTHTMMRWPEWVVMVDQKMAGAMKHQAALLLDRLDRHEPHVGPRDRFANRLRVGRVILLSLDIRLHVGRRYKTHDMSNCLKLARPVMRRCASFDANEARWELREKL